MRALRWIIIIVAVVVVLGVLAIAIGGFWLNNYIHSEGFRHDIETRAGQSLGGTVQIQKVDFDIFNGVKLQGLVTQIDPSHAHGQGALLVKVEKVDCTYAWKELFNRTLKLTGVTLDKPQIVLTKQPTPPAAKTPPPTTSGMPTGEIKSGANGSASFQFVLDRAKINDGTIAVKDESGATTVDLQGVNVSADTSGYTEGKDVTGTLSIADLALASGLRAKDFSTPFAYRSGAIDAKPFTASAFGGNVTGDYSLGNSTPSILDLNGKGFDVTQIAHALNPNSTLKLSGTLDLQSKWRGAETGDLNGEGDVQMTNGKLEGVKILQELSSILRVNELKEPAITKAQSHFLVGGRQTQFTGLQAESPVFKLTGSGVVGFDGGLNADLVLVLSKNTIGKMPKELAASFVQQQDGSGSIAFHVSGSTSNPQTDLPQRLLMQNTQIQSVISKQLNRFFNKKSSDQNQNQNQDGLPQNPLAP